MCVVMNVEGGKLCVYVCICVYMCEYVCICVDESQVAARESSVCVAVFVAVCVAACVAVCVVACVCMCR